jgi:hypothetical protein
VHPRRPRPAAPPIPIPALTLAARPTTSATNWRLPLRRVAGWARRSGCDLSAGEHRGADGRQPAPRTGGCRCIAWLVGGGCPCRRGHIRREGMRGAATARSDAEKDAVRRRFDVAMVWAVANPAITERADRIRSLQPICRVGFAHHRLVPTGVAPLPANTSRAVFT